jgi:addiction module RelB/DinJ family antitoxin
MPKSANIYVRVEPHIKEQAEAILSKLGISMANAIQIYLNQIVLRGGIPFEIKLPQETTTKIPLVYSELSKEEFDVEIQKGIDDINTGRISSVKQIINDVQERYKHEI